MIRISKRLGSLNCWLQLCSLGVLLASQWCWADVPKIEIKFSAPVFVLPQFTGPYEEREASIAPEEYETAETMRGLLEADKRDEVLAELEKFYSIELSPAMLMLQAQIYFSLEMHDKAEETYLAVLKRMPQLVRAHSDLGQLYLVLEQPEKARLHLSRAVALGSNDALIHGQLGYLNLSLFGPFSAISSYQHAAALEPENIQWQQGLLAALTQARMFDAAKALLRDMINRQPKEPNLWLNQAALWLHEEDYHQALVSLEMALLLGDDDSRNLRAVAQLHLQLGSYSRPLDLLDISLQKNNLDMASINEYYTWLSQLGMWDKARQMLDVAGKTIERLNPDEQSQYYLYLAQVESQQGQPKQVASHFRRSLELNPANGESLLAYALFAAKQKDYVDAELLYMRAEAVSQVEKKAQLGRAQLYIQMEDYQAALNLMRSAYQKFPDLVHLKENIEILENIIRTSASIGT
jgi:tetratricopeptide (TPR) repeat protein